uniref:Secreted protein n=1 Tax=Arundo donax TaxID=35708 RepID=A0A0A9G325_ARUDO
MSLIWAVSALMACRVLGVAAPPPMPPSPASSSSDGSCSGGPPAASCCFEHAMHVSIPSGASASHAPPGSAHGRAGGDSDSSRWKEKPSRGRRRCRL